MNPIKRFQKGDAERTALHTDAINELVDAVNTILGCKVSPEGAASFNFQPGGSVLTLNTYANILFDVWINGTLQLVQVNGRIL